MMGVPLALGDDDALTALFNDRRPTALFNDRRPTAPCRLLAHFDGAHPVLGLNPYAKAGSADDNADVRCRTFFDDPTTLGRRFLNDIEVRQRRGNDCRQPDTNHQRLHVSLLVGRTRLSTSSVCVWFRIFSRNYQDHRRAAVGNNSFGPIHCIPVWKWTQALFHLHPSRVAFGGLEVLGLAKSSISFLLNYNP